MKSWMGSVFLFTLVLLEGVFSQEKEERKPPKCNNPKGRLFESILNGECGQSVCKRSEKNKATWQTCPKAATEDKLNMLEETMKMNNKAMMAAFTKIEELVKAETKKVEEKVDEVCGIPTTVWETTMEDQTTSGPLAYVERLPKIERSWKVGEGRVDSIDFVPSKDISIKGISLYRSSSGSHRYTGLIRLKTESSGSVIASQTFDFFTDDSKTYHNQLFASEYDVKTGTKYTITLAYDGTYGAHPIYRGNDGLSSTSADCGGETVNFQFYKSDDFEGEINNGSGVTYGQIPRIIFSC